jgi:hypothetical protein
LDDGGQKIVSLAENAVIRYHKIAENIVVENPVPKGGSGWRTKPRPSNEDRRRILDTGWTRMGTSGDSIQRTKLIMITGMLQIRAVTKDEYPLTPANLSSSRGVRVKI